MHAAPQSKSLVHLEQVAIGYRRPLLPAFDLEISPGELIGVVGPNGAGKSTLLETMCGILPPLSGRVTFPGGRPRIGYVPQRGALDSLWPLSAREVVALNAVPQLSLFGRLGRSHYERADRELVDFGIGEVAEKPFRELSGGQRQRVLLARASSIDPQLLVLDEPTSALDPVGEERLIAELARLARERSIAIVIVSHRLTLTARVAQRLVLLDKDRDFFRFGTTAELLEPEVLREMYGADATVEHVDGVPLIRFSV